MTGAMLVLAVAAVCAVATRRAIRDERGASTLIGVVIATLITLAVGAKVYDALNDQADQSTKRNERELEQFGR